MLIRKFNDTDLERVMSIWLDSNVRVHSFIPKTYWEIAFNFVKRAIPLSEVYVYENDGDVCGFIGLDDTYVVGLFVEESKRSTGIGNKLIDYAKTIKAELSLNVYQKNERAISFYKREQFVIDSESVDANTNEPEFVLKWKKSQDQ